MEPYEIIFLIILGVSVLGNIFWGPKAVAHHKSMSAPGIKEAYDAMKLEAELNRKRGDKLLADRDKFRRLSESQAEALTRLEANIVLRAAVDTTTTPPWELDVKELNSLNNQIMTLTGSPSYNENLEKLVDSGRRITDLLRKLVQAIGLDEVWPWFR